MATDFNLDDLRRQLDQLQAMGSESTEEDGELTTSQIRLMLDAMTPEERHDVDRITSSRLPEIAVRSGMRPQDVEEFLDQFRKVSAMMRHMRGQR